MYLEGKLPKFTINFASPLFDWQRFLYKGKIFDSFDFIVPLESLHVYGDKDVFAKELNEHILFPNPVIVRHPEGHKIPKQFSTEND